MWCPAEGKRCPSSALSRTQAAQRLLKPPHPFSGATLLASLEGLPDGLDGHYPVTASNAEVSRTEFTIELFKGVPAKRTAEVEAAVQRAVAAGGVTVRWAFVEGTLAAARLDLWVAGTAGFAGCRHGDQLHAFARVRDYLGSLTPPNAFQ